MDKRCALRDAIELVANGSVIALGGMTLYRRPVAAARALAQADRRDLTVVAFTAGMETDLLIGAGAVKRLRSCYAGLEFAGFAPHFTRAAVSGRIEIVEETEYTLTYAVQAAAMQVPFLPMRDSLCELDIAKVRPDLRRFACPITGAPLLAVPALCVDVAFIHALAADRFGNACLPGQLALDPLLPAIAKATVLTCERIVETEELARLPGGMRLPGIAVTHVVVAPRGSAPCSCIPDYDLNVSAVLDYVDAAGDRERWRRWLEVD
jgi:glutaconate CoA-transferase, subunit A